MSKQINTDEGKNDLKAMLAASLKPASEADSTSSTIPAAAKPNKPFVLHDIKPMAADQIRNNSLLIQPGTTFKIHFDATAGIAEMHYLRGMIVSEVVFAPESGVAAYIEAVGKTGDWGEARNKLITLKALAGWDYNWFWGRLGRRLDYLKVVEE